MIISRQTPLLFTVRCDHLEVTIVFLQNDGGSNFGGKYQSENPFEPNHVASEPREHSCTYGEAGRSMQSVYTEMHCDPNADCRGT